MPIQTILRNKIYDVLYIISIMYQQFKRIISDLTSITPLEKQPVQTTPNTEDDEEDELYHELPLNYTRRDDNDTPDMDATYEYKFSENYKFREFYYLQDELNKHYDCQGTKTIHLCIFAFNDSCFFDGEPYPFLQFLAKKTPKYSFPSFLFECPSNLDEEQLQIHFRNNCLKHVLDFFVIEGSNLHTYATDNMNRSYRGFIENDNDIYAVYDMTNFMKLPMRTIAKSTEWCLSSELRDANLSDVRVVDFFDKYKYMSTIQSNNTITQPVAMYLYDIAKREPLVNSKKQSILEPRSSHPLYGNFYYFVDSCSLSNRGCRKCAVFLENIVENGANVSGGGGKTEVDHASEPEEHTVDANHAEDTIFEYSDDDDSLDEIVDESFSEIEVDESLEEPSEEPAEEPTEEPSEEPSEKEISQEPVIEAIPENTNEYSMPFTSIIAFNENNTKIWCVKTESLFTEL